MNDQVGNTVHPRYKGLAEWEVQAVAKLPQPIAYSDPAQGEVTYDPRILWLQRQDHERVLWFAYWISTDRTLHRLKWGQGAPMLEEGTLLALLKDGIRQGFLTKGSLRELHAELSQALEA